MLAVPHSPDVQETGPSLHKEAVAGGKNWAGLMANVVGGQEGLTPGPLSLAHCQ